MGTPHKKNESLSWYWFFKENLLPVVKMDFYLLLSAVSLAAFLGVGGPLLLKFSVDKLMLLANDSARNTAVVLVGAYICALWLEKMVREYKSALYVCVEQSAQRKLVEVMLKALIGMEAENSFSRSDNAVHEELSNGLIGFRMIFNSYAMVLIPIVFQFSIMLVVFLVFYGVAYFLVMLAGFFVYTLLFLKSTQKLKYLQLDALKYRVCAGAKMTDALSNLEAVRAFSLEDHVIGDIDGQMSQAEERWVQFSKKRLLYNVIQVTVIVLAISVVLIMAFRQVRSDVVSVGDLILLFFYLASIIQPMESLSVAYKEIKQGEVLFSKMAKYLEHMPISVSLPRIKLGSALPPSIEFCEVSYMDSKNQSILNNVSFTVEGGSFTAVVGESGSGKTTLSKILMRFYDPSDGKILVGGLDASEFNKESLRKIITWVPQNVSLFNESIFDNVRVGDLFSPASNVWAAIESAKVSAFLIASPDDPQGKKSSAEYVENLSGGEKQRIAIARAFLRNSQVIILDEATSALDTISERFFFSNLKHDLAHVTRLIITHRLEAVVDADSIIVMLNGQVVETGTHAELLASEGEYSRLWKSRLAG
ncbi:ABC transporter ATP-binding protein/permease [Pseudomonas syringae pv. theae]|nr:ABC transporter ATP-binding protein [Pseudomonas syringae]MBL3833823.1 ABC transporter ATP-binding protein [Pseudomonas syringae pv. theae]GKS05350.1 ABC transporter ATP-binding protein/permease [Pseudomonas syringae pv. theae]